MIDEWGPWIEHDGKGCPCVGQWVQAIVATPQAARFEVSHGRFDGPIWEGRATGIDGWNGPTEGFEIIRYRIRKPRGLTILEGLLENLPEMEDAE
jgi:hypothetical protein